MRHFWKFETPPSVFKCPNLNLRLFCPKCSFFFIMTPPLNHAMLLFHFSPFWMNILQFLFHINPKKFREIKVWEEKSLTLQRFKLFSAQTFTLSKNRCKKLKFVKLSPKFHYRDTTFHEFCKMFTPAFRSTTQMSW